MTQRGRNPGSTARWRGCNRLLRLQERRPRTYHCDLGTIEHLSIKAHLYFGFVSGSGELTATPEKAFLDVCYFTYRGRRFSFDPASDINLERLDFDIIAHYLESYDVRFVSFFNSIWKK